MQRLFDYLIALIRLMQRLFDYLIALIRLMQRLFDYLIAFLFVEESVRFVLCQIVALSVSVSVRP
jgi:hypothetical protein